MTETVTVGSGSFGTNDILDQHQTSNDTVNNTLNFEDWRKGYEQNKDKFKKVIEKVNAGETLDPEEIKAFKNYNEQVEELFKNFNLKKYAEKIMKAPLENKGAGAIESLKKEIEKTRQISEKNKEKWESKDKSSAKSSRISERVKFFETLSNSVGDDPIAKEIFGILIDLYKHLDEKLLDKYLWGLPGMANDKLIAYLDNVGKATKYDEMMKLGEQGKINIDEIKANLETIDYEYFLTPEQKKVIEDPKISEKIEAIDISGYTNLKWQELAGIITEEYVSKKNDLNWEEIKKYTPAEMENLRKKGNHTDFFTTLESTRLKHVEGEEIFKKENLEESLSAFDELIENSNLSDTEKLEARKMQGKYMTAHFRTEIRENAEHSKERLEYLKEEYRNEENPLTLTKSFIEGKMNNDDFINKIDASQQRIIKSLKTYERD